MQTPSTCLKLATLLALAASAVLPAAAQTSGATSTVVYAGGNDLVIKASDGKLLNFTVPKGTMFTTGGKQVSLSDLKPGAKLTAPVSTGSDGQIVTSIAVAKGKVFVVTPPDGVTLSLAEGTKELVVPAGTTFMVDGKKLTASELKPGMMVEATIVTTAADGTSAASAPALSGALLIAHDASAADDLPAAGTRLPLFAALGAACLALGFALLAFRKPVNQI
jgi:UDP-N-acetylmuramyl tripeptide synthase